MATPRDDFFSGLTPTAASIGLGIGITETQQRSVYNSTTIPLTTTNGGDWRLRTNYNKSDLKAITSVGTNTITTRSEATQTEESKQLKEKVIYENGQDPRLSKLPSRNPVDIEFKDLSLTVQMGFRKEAKEILHSISGKFPGSQLIAIMGPSGAGKSTLLDALSGFKVTGVNSSISVNGRRRDLTTFRRMSCYITQDDRLQPLLTVNENMHIASDLKLGSTMPYEDKEGRIEEILSLLGLYTHVDTMTQRLSGGQKKRLSIALELINNPTVMFLDEPTTGLDSSSCTKVLELLKELTQQGRTIICTIHQPTAKLFQIFDQVYVLSAGNCVYQGSTHKLVPFLQAVNLPCPVYHNPADYIIELACGEYGSDKVDILKRAAENGNCHTWFANPESLLRTDDLLRKYPILPRSKHRSLEDTSFSNQLSVLLKRGFMKAKRDKTLTHLRIAVNIFVAVMLGGLYASSGKEGSRVLDNYNLLFAILMHHSMTTMMLTVLTFPMEMSILLKEHFNRWYSLKAYYTSITLVDLPIAVFCCLIFSTIIYGWSYQPMEWNRFWMFFAISLLTVFVGQAFGLMIGGWFNVVNGTFLAPVMTIPMMMFAGFGVTLRDLPSYLVWGSHISYLRYGLEGYVGAIYGGDRGVLDCDEALYCHYRYPKKFLEEITMQGDQFWKDFIVLIIMTVTLRVAAFIVLKMKIQSVK